MTDQIVSRPPLWLRIINSQRFAMSLTWALSASGVFGLHVFKSRFPDLNPGIGATYIIDGLSFAIPWLINWYRDHPDNFLARARKVINGGTASQSAINATAVTVENAPPSAKPN